MIQHRLIARRMSIRSHANKQDIELIELTPDEYLVYVLIRNINITRNI